MKVSECSCSRSVSGTSLNDDVIELVKVDEEANRQDSESNAESVYDLIDRMPSFWRRSETEATMSTTLFVFSSNFFQRSTRTLISA